MLSDMDPDTDDGELVARECGANDTGSSTMTSMSLLLSSASASGGNEPGCSSLLREIWPRTWAHTHTHTHTKYFEGGRSASSSKRVKGGGGKERMQRIMVMTSRGSR